MSFAWADLRGCTCFLFVISNTNIVRLTYFSVSSQRHDCRSMSLRASAKQSGFYFTKLISPLWKRGARGDFISFKSSFFSLFQKGKKQRENILFFFVKTGFKPVSCIQNQGCPFRLGKDYIRRRTSS